MYLEVNIKKQLDTMCLQADFRVDNEVLALLGASGSGKSMTLKCIAGIETPDEGRIVLGDQVLFDSALGIHLPPQKRRIGYLFQEYVLYPHFTVEQNIHIVAGDRGRTESLLEEFGILDIRTAYPSGISGGQRQRAALARMVAARPQVILLDEPFSALDNYWRAEIMRATKKAIERLGGTTIFVTHSFKEVLGMAQSVACIKEGVLEPKTSLRDFLQGPKTKTEAMLMGYSNLSQIVQAGPGQYCLQSWGISVELSEELLQGRRLLAIDHRRLLLTKPVAALDQELIEVPVEACELMEDDTSWNVYAFPPGAQEQYLYASFSKREYSIEEIQAIKKIYIRKQELLPLSD